MQRLLETSKISEVLQTADTKVGAQELHAAFHGVVVEVTNGIEFEGTLLYFPGVTLQQLKREEYF